jgi:hypothetical protein
MSFSITGNIVGNVILCALKEKKNDNANWRCFGGVEGNEEFRAGRTHRILLMDSTSIGPSTSSKSSLPRSCQSPGVMSWSWAQSKRQRETGARVVTGIGKNNRSSVSNTHLDEFPNLCIVSSAVVVCNHTLW